MDNNKNINDNTENNVNNIDKNLLELCELRLKNPTFSLKELAEILKISKSGVNHRFKKIMEMANKI